MNSINSVHFILLSKQNEECKKRLKALPTIFFLAVTNDNAKTNFVFIADKYKNCHIHKYDQIYSGPTGFITFYCVNLYTVNRLKSISDVAALMKNV